MTLNVKPTLADLRTLALAAVGLVAPDGLADEPVWTADMLGPCVAAIRTAPDAKDRRLVELAAAMRLSDAELMTVALCAAAEGDAAAARAVAHAQAPLGGSRPLVGLAAAAFAALGASPLGLAAGAAAACGLLQVGDEAAALPERSLKVPLSILAALEGLPGAWAGLIQIEPPDIPLPTSMADEAKARARSLAGRSVPGLVIRSASTAEALAAAVLFARTLGLGLVRIDGEAPAGLAPWLLAAGRAPVFAPRLAPGEHWSPPRLAPYPGPWLVVTGQEGVVDAEVPPDEWTLPVPGAPERARLWRAAGASRAIAQRAAESYRQGPGRIAEAAARARLQAARRGAETLGWADIAAGVALGAGGMAGLARTARRPSATRRWCCRRRCARGCSGSWSAPACARGCTSGWGRR